MKSGRNSANRLAQESSPYLRQHADNPVDWHPWDEEALERARREEKPIFLSVGYSTCHWCHVMERESFSDPQIARFLNDHFVSIKVDREERPDLDDLFMTATQVLTGQGGWPNSVFLTPDLKPYYAGTYFPPEERWGRPSFVQVLEAMAHAWRDRREDVETQAGEVARAVRHVMQDRGEPAESIPGSEAEQRSLEALAASYDDTWGGFGQAPKFPTPANLLLLLDRAAEDERARRMLAGTLDGMARGGLYDQVGGGFHRYSVDREWRVPHFEKMLYDQGLLLEVYARWYDLTGDVQAERVCRATVEFLRRELTSSGGAFWSAIDADSEGEEGTYYVWTRQQLEAALGAEQAAFAAPLLGLDGPPNFESRAWVLHQPAPLAAAARRRHLDEAELAAELDRIRERLLAARDERSRPATDTKLLADWNGIAIRGVATAARVLAHEEWLEAAQRAAESVLDELWPSGGPLCHVRRPGGDVSAMLGDYAFLIGGLLALAEASGEPGWVESAVRLRREQQERLGDPRGGFFSASERRDLWARNREVFDGALPSGNGMAALVDLELAERTGDATWVGEAERTLRAFAPVIEQRPDAARLLALAAGRRARHGGRRQEGEEAGAAHERQARQLVTPRLDLGEPDGDGWRPFSLQLEIEPGWHLTAPGSPGGVGRPLELSAPSGTELGDVEFPAGSPLREAGEGEPPLVYEGNTRIVGRLRSAGAPALDLVVQPCELGRCLRPASIRISA